MQALGKYIHVQVFLMPLEAFRDAGFQFLGVSMPAIYFFPSAARATDMNQSRIFLLYSDHS